MQDTAKVRLPLLQSNADISAYEPLSLPDSPFGIDDVPPIHRASLNLNERTQLRTSGYTIYVDLPGNTEEMLLIHGYSGAFDKVSRTVATYLRTLESKTPPKPLYGAWTPEPPLSPHDRTSVPKPSEETLRILKKRGYLTAMTEDEETAFFTKLALQLHHRAVHRAPGYILVPTYQCNLRCPYCFQDHMRTDPEFRHLLRVVDRPMVDRWFAGMQSIEKAHGLNPSSELTRNLLFFGGEPLLAESLPIVRYIVDRAQTLGKARLSAITNATDLHHYKDLLGPGKIAWLQITIDGPPAQHNERRIYEDGSGSFGRIAENLTMALELGVKVNVRMNVDRQNIGLLPELAALFEQLGWSRHKDFSAYVAPIHAANEQTDEKTTMNSWELNRALSDLKKTNPLLSTFGGADDALTSKTRSIFDKRSDPTPHFRADFCGAHTSMYILDAFGDIYACWERMGDPNIRIGRIGDDGQVSMNPALMRMWRSRSVVSNDVCRKCRYATYCGGGCAVLAEDQHGSLHANHCDGFAKRFRESAAQSYLDHLSGAAVTADAERICDL